MKSMLVATAALLLGLAPSASAEFPTDQLEQRMFHIGLEASGYPVYIDETGKQVVSPKKVTVKVESVCTGTAVSPHGHILTAEHCFNKDMNRQALIDKFNDPLKYTDPEAPVQPSIEEILDDMMKPDLQVVDVWGTKNTMTGAPVPGSDFDMRIFVWQRQYMPGMTLTQGAVDATFVGSIPTDEGDVAVIQIPLQTPFLRIGLSDPSNDEDIAAAGYPGSVSQLLANENPMQKAIVTEGKATQLHPYNMGKPGMQVTATIGHGMSGGPIVKRGVDGQLVIVGVISNGTEGFGFASTTSDIRRVLQTNAVPFQSEPVQQQRVNAPQSYSQPPMIVHTEVTHETQWLLPLTIVGTALLLAGIMLIAVVIRRRRPTRGHGFVIHPVADHFRA